MDDGVAVVDEAEGGAVLRQPRAFYRRKRWAIPLGVLALLLLTLATGWLARERIADNIIADALRRNNIPATYKVDSIAPERQILRDIVVGNPARPDLTVAQAIVHLRYRWGRPEITRVEIVSPRLYGAWRDGRFSFGTLDRYLYRDSNEPPELPALDIVLVDGRARLATPYGAVGLKAEGRGPIRDGFKGLVAATGPRLAVGDCAITGTTLFGRLVTKDGVPSFAGPARFGLASCSQNTTVRDATLQLDLTSGTGFDDVTGSADIVTARVASGAVNAAGLGGKVRGSLHDGHVRASYTLAARRLAHPAAAAALVTFTGDALYAVDPGELRMQTQVKGNGLRPGTTFASALQTLSNVGESTLVAPLAWKFAAALQAQAPGSSVDGELTLTSRGGMTSVTIPRAQLKGRGSRLLARLSGVQIAVPRRGAARLAGNFALEGPGLPQLTGRMEQAGGGQSMFRLSMAEYQAGTSRLALPTLTVRQGSGGSWSFTGDAEASGPLPNGFVQQLRLPVDGRWSGRGGLVLWPNCVMPRFGSLRYANLTLQGQSLRLCPGAGGAIVRTGGSGITVTATTPRLALQGQLGRNPIRLVSGPVSFSAPGAITARQLEVALGPSGTASRFVIAQVDGRIGRESLAGRFSDTDVRLNNVPLDIEEASGSWRFANGALALTDGAFRLLDRQENDRFSPLTAQGARLSLVNNRIAATADLQEPETGRLVTQVDLLHDLASGTGSADLAVPGVLFDRVLQPADLSRLALGVVANTRGVVTGTGRIDWNSAGVTSTGAFSSDKLDFAAAFGPVRGASGTVRFSDLLGLTTEPGQTLRVASINPGIEVNDGEIALALVGGRQLAVQGGRWPFLGGTLTMLPVDLRLGTSEVRRYDFRIDGLDAARFIERFGVGNLSATGVFDGSLSIVFDEQGNGRVEDGLLVSRAPGGNLSYVGELTYKDLSPYANFAFDALKSLDWQRMTIAMKGPLAGDIVTTARFDGVTQGAGARRNFITRRIGRLPLRFVVNIQAPFARLITSLRSLYDPAFVRDPRELGLLQDDGTRFVPVTPAPPAGGQPLPPIQDQASENMP